MEGDKRRDRIIEILTHEKKPLSGSALAGMLFVSRQIIVGDIALLRAQGVDIISTNSGYIINETERSVVVKVSHKGEDAFDEMCTIIDEGAKISDIYIEHSVYGKVCVPYKITSRADAKRITEKMLVSNEKSLQELTKGVHYHTITAPNEIILIRVERALKEKGYIVK